QPLAPRPAVVLPRLQLGMASFGDADHGAVTMIGPSPAIYQTSNGGRIWIKHPSGALAMTFLDRGHAGAGGQWEIGSTTDSGLTWRSSQAPFSLGSFGLLVGAGIVGGPTFLDPANAWWLDAGPGPPSLWRSFDGGSTWRRLAGARFPSGHRLGQPVFVDAFHGAIVMSGLETDSWPSVLTTEDAGESWREVAIPVSPVAGAHLALPTPLAAILLAHDGALVLSLIALPAGVNAASVFGPSGDARSGMFLRWSSVSRDGGLTWWPWAPEPALSLSAWSWPAFDGTGRLMLMDDQRLWISRDEGRTWQAHPVHMPHGDHA